MFLVVSIATSVTGKKNIWNIIYLLVPAKLPLIFIQVIGEYVVVIFITGTTPVTGKKKHLK